MSFAELDPHLFVPRVFAGKTLVALILWMDSWWATSRQVPWWFQSFIGIPTGAGFLPPFYAYLLVFFWTSHVRSCDAGPAGAGSAAFNLFCISAVCVSAIKDKEACLRNVAGEGNPRWWDSFLPKKSGGYSSYPIFKLEMGEVTWS